MNFRAAQRVRFRFDGVSHYVGVRSVNSARRAVIEVASAPQTATLGIGESRSFNITGDIRDDLRVTVRNVTGGNVSLIIEAIEFAQPPAQNNTSNGTAVVNVTDDDEDIDEEAREVNKFVFWIVVFVLSVGILTLVVLIMRSIRIKKRIERVFSQSGSVPGNKPN